MVLPLPYRQLQARLLATSYNVVYVFLSQTYLQGSALLFARLLNEGVTVVGFLLV